MKKFISILLFITGSFYAQSIDTIQVVTGWNLIGALQTGSSLQIMNTIPSGIIISIYGFIPGIGYEPADNMNRGKGYWVKVSQGGKIIFTSTISGGGGPCPGVPTVSFSGKTYNTVQIGTQCWLKENLDVGVMIPGTQTPTNNGVIEKYCYTDDQNFCNTYGALYQWDEAMQYTITPGVQGICPPGWHIPTLAEYETLSASAYNNGNALKAAGQGTGEGAGNNLSGFSGLLAGRRYSNGTFGGGAGIGVFWCSTQYNSFYAIYMHFYNTGKNIGLTDLSKKYGFSVRCVMN